MAGSEGAEIQDNTVGNTQGGIAIVSIPGSVADDTSIKDNWIYGTVSVANGIEVCSNSNRVQGNTLHDSSQAGINLDSSCGGTGNNNKVQGNTINEACAGVLLTTGETGNNISGNSFFNVLNTVLTSPSDSCTPAGPLTLQSEATTTPGEAHYQPKL